jgi:hypothetical protein
VVPSNKLAAQTSAELENELAKFRNEWKMELLEQDRPPEQRPAGEREFKAWRKGNLAESGTLTTRARNTAQQQQTSTVAPEPVDLDYQQPKTNEEKAKYLFDKGVQLEQQGRHYEAIKFYRMSMQLDADIEFKIASNKPAVAETSPDENQDVDEVTTTAEKEFKIEPLTSEEDEFKNLYERFFHISLAESKLCEKNYPQKVSTISITLLKRPVMVSIGSKMSNLLDLTNFNSFIFRISFVCSQIRQSLIQILI